MNARRTAYLVTLARRMVVSASSAESHAHQAFDLAHRARRLLERAAETASRDRWSVLSDPRGETMPKDKDAQFAIHIGLAVVKYPVHGQPAVYAALLDAVDQAIAVSDVLYHEWLETQPRVGPLKVDAVNRTGGPMARGCKRVEPLPTEGE